MRASSRRTLHAVDPGRGQDSAWAHRNRMTGMRSTKKTATPPGRGRKHGSKAGRR